MQAVGMLWSGVPRACLRGFAGYRTVTVFRFQCNLLGFTAIRCDAQMASHSILSHHFSNYQKLVWSVLERIRMQQETQHTSWCLPRRESRLHAVTFCHAGTERSDCSNPSAVIAKNARLFCVSSSVLPTSLPTRTQTKIRLERHPGPRCVPNDAGGVLMHAHNRRIDHLQGCVMRGSQRMIIPPIRPNDPSRNRHALPLSHSSR
jgi:hypothetical protein